MAMKISFTFMEVFAEVSMKSKLLSSAYDCASYRAASEMSKKKSNKQSQKKCLNEKLGD